MRSRSVGLLLLMSLVSPLTACGNENSGDAAEDKKPAVEQQDGSKGEDSKKDSESKKDEEKHDEGGEGGEGGEG